MRKSRSDQKNSKTSCVYHKYRNVLWSNQILAYLSCILITEKKYINSYFTKFWNL